MNSLRPPLLAVLALLLLAAPARSPAQEEERPADESPPRRVAPEISDGYHALQQGDTEGAIRQFGLALRKDRDDTEALFGLATAYTKLDDAEKAFVVYERLLALDPDAFQVLNNMAWLCATTKDHTRRDPRRAIELAQKALLLQPENYHVWSTLAEARYLSREYERSHRAAMEAYRLAEAAGLPPDRMEVYRQQVLKCRSAMQAMMLVD